MGSGLRLEGSAVQLVGAYSVYIERAIPLDKAHAVTVILIPHSNATLYETVMAMPLGPKSNFQHGNVYHLLA